MTLRCAMSLCPVFLSLLCCALPLAVHVQERKESLAVFGPPASIKPVKGGAKQPADAKASQPAVQASKTFTPGQGLPVPSSSSSSSSSSASAAPAVAVALTNEQRAKIMVHAYSLPSRFSHTSHTCHVLHVVVRCRTR